MKRLRTAALTAGAVAILASGVAIAQSRAVAGVQARQANFKQLGGAFKAINDELKKDAPDPVALRTNAARLSTLAGQLPTWFPKGSGAEAGVKTGAKPGIWSDPKGFADAAKSLQVQASQFALLGAGGDLAAFKAQVRPVGGACKGCHDKYRVEEKK